MAYETILFEKNGHVATITLNRPHKLNALTSTTMAELSDSFAIVDKDDEIRAVILTGAGEKAFTSGFDLELVSADTTAGWEKLIRSNYDTLMQIWRVKKPVIAAVNGFAVAAGVSLAMACDIVIASEHAVFAEPEIRHVSMSPLLILPWIAANQKLINYHYYTGDPIDAALAEKLGMAAKVVPAAQLRSEAERMAQRIAMVPPFAVQMTKMSLLRTFEIMGMTNALDHHRALDTIVLSATGIEEKEHLNRVFQAEGIKGFLKARDGRFNE